MARTRGEIDGSAADWILLISANEDYIGLYEAIWEFNSRFPNASLGEKYAAAERALRSLHSKDFIEFHRMVFSDDYKSHSYEPINPIDLDDILSNPVSWYPDYVHVRIVFTATQAGERAYFSGEAQPA